MIHSRIAVTAMGLHTALGQSLSDHSSAMLAARSGLTHPSVLPTRHAESSVAGEIKLTDENLRAALSPGGRVDDLTRSTLLCISALKGLMTGPAGGDRLRNAPLAFINAGTVGGMSTAEQYYTRLIDLSDNVADAARFIDTLDCAETTNRAAAYFGLKPLMATISTACSSSANALLMGARLIRQGVVKRAICGGADALSRFTLNGFLSLKNVDAQACRPFDEHRAGLNLGEGAAFLLLEKEEDARADDIEPVAILSGWHNCNDAYHPTAPSPAGDGACAAMLGALSRAGLRPQDISYINAHGTATLNNDISEGTAIQRLFGEWGTPFSSTKPFTGHTLAAAGSVEAILSILALQEGFIPPNLNFTTAMPELVIAPQTTPKRGVNMQHVLSNSFGFGGANASLIFSRAN